MTTNPLVESHQKVYYTNEEREPLNKDSKNLPDTHLNSNEEIHIFGIMPHAPREDVSLPAIEAIESFKVHSQIEISNLLWSFLIGWWLCLTFWITGILFLITGFLYKQGLFCFRAGLYCLFPFGRYAYKENNEQNCSSLIIKFFWILFSPIYLFGCLLSSFFSWELVYYIPMAKNIYKLIKLCFSSDPSQIKFGTLINHNPKSGHFPLLMCQTSGSWFYFRFTVFGFEVVYLNFSPLIIIALICGYAELHGTIFEDNLFGTFVALFAATPCAYIIGICVDELSKQFGVIIGSILNAFFFGLVELLLYYFSLRVGLTSVVRAAITGAFLMNLLIIPGFAMFAAGLKWKDIILNKKAQAVSGTYLLLAIVSVLFPSIFYHVHKYSDVTCRSCSFIGNLTNNIITSLNCSMCATNDLQDLGLDPIYQKYAGPLNYIMAILMPFIFILGVFFSVKTHSHIYKVDAEHEHESEMNSTFAIIMLFIATILFSLMCHVMTEKIPHAIERLQLSERFVGLIFYTLIPNAAEYMNAIKFALNGNIGLSMEIGNQAAILTALTEMPALVLLSYLMHSTGASSTLFTLVFPLIDIFCVIIAVLLRNSILGEKSVNYSTGIAFLLIFGLISVVYYFEVF